jgi:hypothetical protein
MAGIARPPVLGGICDQLGSKRIGLDIPENHQQVSVILNHGALEPALPDMTRGVMALVVAPGMGDRKRLEDSADRLPGLGPDHEVEVIGHEAIAEEAKRVTILGLGESFEKGDAIVVIAEDITAVIATVESVIDQAVIDGAR